MWELPPFIDCPLCEASGKFGILSVDDHSVHKRCSVCQYDQYEPLPELNKRVIYLDQNAISEVFKVKTGKRSPDRPHHTFWLRVTELVQSVVRLQQAVFPLSSVHNEETLVSKDNEELRIAHEMLGDCTLKRTTEVHEDQLYTFAKAYFGNQEIPTINFSVDDVLETGRNVWLPRFLVTVTDGRKLFADGIRGLRSDDALRLNALAKIWAAEHLPFKDLLKRELKSYGPATWRSMSAAMQRAVKAWDNEDSGELFNTTLSEPYHTWMYLSHCLAAWGIAENEMIPKMRAYLHWDGLEQMPINRLQSYLFAALARKAQSGQKHFSRGMLNDIRVISAYAPYVDVMFLDNECAALLAEEPLKTDLGLAQKVFSLNNGNRFIAYLEAIERGTPNHVRESVKEVYGAADTR